MATTVDTSTSTLATFGQRVTAVESDGTDWVALWNNTDDRVEFWYSTNDGATWTESTGLRITQTSAALFRDMSFHIDWQDCGVVAIATNSAFGSLNRSVVKWTGGVAMSDATSWSDVEATVPTENFAPAACDVVSFKLSPTLRRVAWVVTGDDCRVFWQDFLLSTHAKSGTYNQVAPDISPSLNADFVAFDFEHVGDGLTAVTNPGAFVVWRASSTTEMLKITNTSGTWSKGTVRTVNASDHADTDPLAAIFDGSRFVMAFIDNDSDTVVQVFERDGGDTTTTERTPPALADGAITSISVGYNGEQDIVLAAVGTTSDDPKYCVYDRSAGTWGAWETLEASTALAGTFSLQRGYQGDGINAVWTSGSSSPYDIEFERVPFNSPPTAPTWLTPADSSTQDAAATLAVTWQFNDPDAGDTQSAYALKRVISGTTTYYRASDSTWQVSEVKNTSTTSGVTLPTSWGADGDTVALSVKTWDAADVEGVYGDALNLTGSTKVNPTLTAPTDAGTITTSRVTVTWTVAEQTAYRVRVLTSADVVLYDSGKVTSTATSIEAPVDLADGLTGAKAEVRTWNNDDLESNTDTHTFDVDFVEPATPTYAITASNVGGYIRVTITDPTPTGSQPDVTSHDVYVRVASGGRPDGERPVGGDGIRIATGVTGTFDDYAAGSGTDYEYRTLAKADNGTSVFGAWT